MHTRKGDRFEYLINPSVLDISVLIETNPGKEARALIDHKTGILYVWPAYYAIHAFFADKLGISRENLYNGYTDMDALTFNLDNNYKLRTNARGVDAKHPWIQQHA